MNTRQWARAAGVALLVGPCGCLQLPAVLRPTPADAPPAEPPATAAVELPDRESARVCLRTAQEYEKNRQAAEAARLFEKARELDPKGGREAGRRLAVLYDTLGEVGRADAEYDRLLADAPKDADLLNDAGYGRYSRGDWAAAAGLFQRAVKADPGHKRARVNLGLALAQQGKKAEALAAFGAAVRPADAHSNLGFVLAARGDRAGAAAEYREALALDPGHKLARAALEKLDAPPTAARPASSRTAP